jgi:hypothetical protein
LPRQRSDQPPSGPCQAAAGQRRSEQSSCDKKNMAFAPSQSLPCINQIPSTAPLASALLQPKQYPENQAIWMVKHLPSAHFSKNTIMTPYPVLLRSMKGSPWKKVHSAHGFSGQRPGQSFRALGKETFRANGIAGRNFRR